ncbi:MAG: hypothetical protein ABFD49_07700 [Armatimonadota bacterium]|nr:hypothetical protein [bacterium]
MQRDIQDIVDALKNRKGCTLLIGAGCSVTAGIPAASGVVECIRKRHPAAHNRAEPKTYPSCMAQLTLGHRRGLIGEIIKNAQINWAHIAIAQLISNGYVDRVLTTNFDPLVVRACALIHEFPAVYDFAASQYFNPAYVSRPSVFYLHGQSTGFVLMNTQKECEEHAKRMEPVFSEAGKGRVWIVVGYSGESDPVFEHLANVERFDYGLFWVCYKDEAPGKHVSEQLLVDGKDAFQVNGFDADSFFVTLARELDCFPPDYIRKPFTHLDNMMQTLTTFSFPGQEGELDITAEAREMIRAAADKYENASESFDGKSEFDSDGSSALEVVSALLEGDYDKAISAGESLLAQNDALAWSYVMSGNALGDQAKTKQDDESDQLFAQAYEKYESALKIKPDMHEALNNWGVALGNQAKTKQGEESDQLFAQAYEKYNSALKIKPNLHEALNNWGVDLRNQTKTKQGAESDRLFAQAYEKYEAALKIKPDKHEALKNWGTGLWNQAMMKQGAESDKLFAQAYEKYEAALKIKPDSHDVLSNWGVTLLIQAKTKQGADADSLLSQAHDKLSEAESLAPNTTVYNMACLSALRNDEAGCREWLTRAFDVHALPSRRHIEIDSDLDSMRDKDWFQDILAHAPV